MLCKSKKQVMIVVPNVLTVQIGFFILTPRRDQPSGEGRGKDKVFFCIFDLVREVIGYIQQTLLNNCWAMRDKRL